MRSKNRIRKIYKDYNKSLNLFKAEMIQAMKNNKALAFAIYETYRAARYRSHYWDVISYFRTNHLEAYLSFCKSDLPGKRTYGIDRFWLTLKCCGYEDIYEKYKNSIPESKAFGLIFHHAINILNENYI